MSANKETLKIYLKESLVFRKHLFTALFLVPLSAVLMGVVIPFLLSRIIELLSHGQRLGDGEFMQTIYATAGVSLLAIIVNRIGYRQLLKLDYNVRARLQQRAFHALLHKSYSFYANHKVGSLTSHYIGFIGAYTRISQIFINDALNLSLTLLVGILIMFTQSVVLGATLLAITLLILAQAYYGARRRSPFRKERKRLTSELHGAIADDIGNNTVVKMFSKEDFEEKTVGGKIQQLKQVFHNDFMMFAHESNLRHGIMLGFQLLAIIMAAHLLQQGAISLGTVIFSLTYLIRLSANLFAVGPIINGYEQAMVEASPMTDVLLEEADVQDKPGAKKLLVDKGEIAFDNVTFKYEDDTNHVFSALNLHIKPGEKIGLVGTSGGGKTTITKLLLRFLDIQDGKITIDSQSIAEVTQYSLRQNIAYVPQEPMLFHRSLKENISYAKPDASHKAIVEAARKAHADEFIKKLPQGYDTIVGERGVKLSGGQKQRIAIARAILANAPILVLDEATSALDSESEKLIQSSLNELMKGRTAIVIAHRLSTIQKMDRIIVLENGNIVEEGTHSQLIAHSGTYANLWSHQSGGFLED